MKKLMVFLGVFIFFISGCAMMMPWERSICVNRPEQFVNSETHICAVAEKYQMPPEEIDNLLLDTSAMLFITDQVDKEQIGDIIDHADAALGPRCEAISYAALLDLIFDDAEKIRVGTSILNRRIGMFYSHKLISDFDCYLIRAAGKHQKEQFGLP